MTKRLYRKRSGAMLGGVCSGLGDYFAIDPTLVRLIFVLLALNGAGVLIYILMWIFVPSLEQGEAPALAQAGEGAALTEKTPAGETADPAHHDRTGLFIVGGALIFLGAILLLRNLFPFFWWFRFDNLWPLLLIVGGAALIWNRVKGE